MLIIGAVALIAFGPDQLPKVARKAGQTIRDVQNTSQSFIREMERAADEQERQEWQPPVTPPPAATAAPYTSSAPYEDVVVVEPHSVAAAESYGGPAKPGVPREDGFSV
jgi:Sec-independent protein translocase protein TatA